jgi:hypothetical protein
VGVRRCPFDARSLGLAFGALSWTDGSGTHAVGFPGALATAPSDQKGNPSTTPHPAVGD